MRKIYLIAPPSFVKSRGTMLGCACRRSVRSNLPLEKILLDLGSARIFGASAVDLEGDVAGIGRHEPETAS
jgi:hypothetical protein